MNRALRYPASSDLSYFNARVRGMRGALFSRADYASVLKAEGLEAFIDRLRATAYGPEVEAAQARFRKGEEALAAALGSALSRTFKLLWAIAPPGAQPLLKAVFSNWEVFDLKAIIRGLSRGLKKEQIRELLVPAGELDGAALNTLLSSRDIPDLIRFLETWGSPYAAPIRSGAGALEKHGRIMEMEIALDRRASEFVLSTLAYGDADCAMMREWMGMKIDLINILTLLKIAGEGYAGGAADFFVAGGRELREKEFIEMAALGGRDEAYAALRARVRGPGLAGFLEQADPGDPAMLEEIAEHSVERRLARLAAIEPLSIALSASFIYMKVRETRNLSVIGRGKRFRMPEEELARLLIYPI